MTRHRSSRPIWLGEDRRTWDHVRVHLQVIEDSRLGAIELAVYLGIAVHGELDSGKAHPSKATLAQYAGISERRVFDALATLQECGYISIKHEAGKASMIFLLPPPTPEPGAGVELSTSAGDAGPVRNVVPGGQERGADELERTIEPNRDGEKSKTKTIRQFEGKPCPHDALHCNRRTVFCDRCARERRELVA